MKKQLLCLLLLLPIMAWADDSGACGDSVTWAYVEATHTLTISGKGPMTNYNYINTINAPWDKYKSDILKAIIEDGVTTIGGSAFTGCNNLTSFTIPNGVTYIGDYAFCWCSSLTSIIIPNSVTTIGGGAFACCSCLISMTIPNSVTTIGSGAFSECSSLTSVDIPNSVTTIGFQTFSGCISLTSVNIPNSITTIGDGAFYDCSSLTSIIIPNGITTIGNSAFYGCSSLTSVNIPDGINSIGYSTFSGCNSLTSVTIPDSVTTIGDYAFNGCRSLTSVNIPNSVMNIGKSAFNGCSTLNYVKLPDSLYMIKSLTFYGCKSLKEIIIPGTVEYIYQEAFAKCGLDSVKVLAEKPPFAYDNTFSNYDIQLYVPKASVSAYQSTAPWSKFSSFKTLTGEDVETKKCATPTIGYSNGKLTFNCETEDAVCQSSISDADINSYSGNEVELGVTYNISVYATKNGYANSDVATATLCWVDVEPKTDGISNGIAQVKAQAVLILSDNGKVTVSGIDDGMPVYVYSVSGQILGSVKASGNQAKITTNLRPGEIAIVKIGEKSVKIVMQ